MEFKGTKGEWESVHVPKTEYVSERYEVQFGKDGECIAEFVHNEYDAKLIASAPDLLEALQGFVNLKDLILPDSDVSIEYEGEAQAVFYVIQKAQKAIEKALL